jgi:hypothetical protein
VSRPTSESKLAGLPGYKPAADRLCRNCGEPMRAVCGIEWYEEGEEGTSARLENWRQKSRPVRVLYYGYDRRELFCTLRCGYMFGVSAVASGMVRKSFG